MEFLTNALIVLPPAHRHREAELVAQEAMRARQFAESGELVRAWRAAGPWGNWCLWDEPDLDALHAALESLPLYPYMDVTIHTLAPHPGDPRSGGDELAGGSA